MLKFLLISVLWTATLTVIFMITASRLANDADLTGIRAPNGYHNTAEVPIIIEFVSADPLTRLITIDWFPGNTEFVCSANTNKVVDIYFDRGVLDSSVTGFSEADIQESYVRLYRHNVTAMCNGKVSPFSSFRTITKLVSPSMVTGAALDQRKSSNIEDYPFDVYFAPLYLFGIHMETRQTVALNVTRSIGNLVNFKIGLHTSSEELNAGTRQLSFILRLTRSDATKMFVVVSGITNWLTAIAFMVICISTILYPVPHIYGEMFVIPVGAVFAFTAIRSGFPGAPSGFGAKFDIYTILPALILMSLCSFFLLMMVLFLRIRASGCRSDIQTNFGFYWVTSKLWILRHLYSESTDK